jgi:hypothetical protein
MISGSRSQVWSVDQIVFLEEISVSLLGRSYLSAKNNIVIFCIVNQTKNNLRVFQVDVFWLQTGLIELGH